MQKDEDELVDFLMEESARYPETAPAPLQQEVQDVNPQGKYQMYKRT